MVAAERDEVTLARRVKIALVPRAQDQLTPANIPTQAKERIEWATRQVPTPELPLHPKSV